jgi:hypothetical protein
MNIHKKTKKIISLFFVFVFVFMFSILTPELSYAHDAAFLLVTIDEGTNLFQGDVILDRVGKGRKAESKHAEAQLGHFTGFIDGSATIGDPSFNEENNGKEGLVFSFPSEDIDKNNVTSADIDRAYYVADTIVPALNDALLLVNGWENYNTTSELKTNAEKLAKHQSIGEWSISEISHDKIKAINPKFKTDKDIKYLAITSSKTNEQHIFPYAIRKGYKGANATMAGDRTYTNDVEWITWRMLVAEAFHAYEKGLTASNQYELIEPSTFELEVETVIEKGLNNLRSFLGLYSDSDLVFNNGVRGTKMYYYGVMPTRWMRVVNKFYLIFMILALCLLALGLISMVIDKSFKTIGSNPVIRVGVMEQIKRLIIAGLLISVSYPLISALLSLNGKIVGIFNSVAISRNNLFGVGFTQSNLGGSILLALLGFFLPLYLNAVYIIRALSIAVLMAGSPMFIATLAFEGSASNVFSSWGKNLIENIFLQSYHAIILSILTTLQVGSRGFENIIISLSIIPLTKLFKSIFFPGGNGFAHTAGFDVGNDLKNGGYAIGGYAAGAYRKGKKMYEHGGGSSKYEGVPKDEIALEEEQRQGAKNDQRIN